MKYFDNLKVVDTRNRPYDRQNDQAHWLVKCPVCDSGTMLAVAIGNIPAGLSREITYGEAGWLMCAVCGMGAFAVGNSANPEKVFPQALPFHVPDHLETQVEQTWLEALRSFRASAYTSCALMCRKLIFHMAVDAGLPAKNDRDRAPRFDQCVDHLVTEGYITQRQKNQWVDSIREWGNTATHDLASTDKSTAHSALEFTLQLLQMVYVFPSAAPGGSKELKAAPETRAISPSSGNAPSPS